MSVIKCVVWDLDGTLWDGTLSDGDDLILNKAAFDAVLSLSANGTIQSIASRNESGSAIRQLTELKMTGYFLHPMIEVDLFKPGAVSEIAKYFNIGTDSVAFVDDDSFNRYEMSNYLPKISVYSPDEIDLLLKNIASGGFSSPGRGEWMASRESRLEAERTFDGSREDFLISCGMRLTVRAARESDLGRIAELQARANRINSAKSGAVEPPDAACFFYRSDCVIYVCDLIDIFGDHGTVGAAIIRLPGGPGAARIESFCVSCRVEGRGVAAAFLGELLNKLQGDSPALTGKNGRYIPRAVDSVELLLKRGSDRRTAIFYKSLGFKIKSADGQATLFTIGLPHIETAVPWIETVSG